MNRYRIAQIMAGVSAVAFFVAAWLHTSGYRAVVQQARRGVSGVAPVVAALWLAYGAAMVVLGGMISLVAVGRIRDGRWILVLAGCFPLMTVLLQLQLLEFTRSSAMLSTVAAVSIAAAVVFPSTREPPRSPEQGTVGHDHV
jgi:hypothetical protein